MTTISANQAIVVYEACKRNCCENPTFTVGKGTDNLTVEVDVYTRKCTRCITVLTNIRNTRRSIELGYSAEAGSTIGGNTVTEVDVDRHVWIGVVKVKGLRGLTLGIQETRGRIKRYRTVCQITLPSASRVLALFAGSASSAPFASAFHSQLPVAVWLKKTFTLWPTPSES